MVRFLLHRWKIRAVTAPTAHTMNLLQIKDMFRE